ncbi:MAG: hypothetical protein ABI164_04895 [Acidobacteriaceae bacterium]
MASNELNVHEQFGLPLDALFHIAIPQLVLDPLHLLRYCRANISPFCLERLEFAALRKQPHGDGKAADNMLTVRMQVLPYLPEVVAAPG